MSSQKQDLIESNNNSSSLSRLSRQHQGDSYTGRGAKLREEIKSSMPKLIGAIDQGTSSTRFLVFENHTGHLIASSQMEIKRVTPQEGWVEIDPNSIMASVYATIANVYDQLVAHYNLPQQLDETSVTNFLSCIGICNQRESTVVWDSITGQPLYNVIVWMDNRTKYIVDEMIDSIPGRDFNRFKDKTGLPMSTYFSAFKLKWLMDNVEEVSSALKQKRLLFGTVDSWILWNLTGGKHLTDVTNASRTFLMDIETLAWDKSLCKYFKVPLNILPEIRASADDFGQLQVGPFKGTPITGVIGDQSAALFGHNCLQIGQTKATFGTGCFIMQNIGPGPISGAMSGVHRDAKRGLVTTVGYKLGNRPACYALEGSIKIAGAALTWLRDNIQLIQNYEECDVLVNKTTHSAGVFFVPALGGLYSPYWDPNAAGIFIGLSQFTRREHLVRATFDSIAFQTNDILSLMRGVANGLMIDGGLCKSDNLCQILADITGYDIMRPAMCETSALGAAMVAGYGASIWPYESMSNHSTHEPISGSLYNYASLNHSTHHYPHELLSQSQAAKQFCRPEAECDSSTGFGGQSKFRSRTKSITSNSAAARHMRNNASSMQDQHSRAELAAANQQHNRQHLKSANGVNDDAGGGCKEGDRGGGGMLVSGYKTGDDLNQHSHRAFSTDYDDAEESIRSSNQLTETGSEAGATNPDSDQCQLELAQAMMSPLESSARDDHRPIVSPTTAIKDAAPPSSGYSSGDNFEQATSLSTQGRVDSPMSHLTDSAGVTSHSVTPCMDLNLVNMTAVLQSSSQEASQQANITDNDRQSTEIIADEVENEELLLLSQPQANTSTSWRRKLRVFPYNLRNFLAQQSALGLDSRNGNALRENALNENDEDSIGAQSEQVNQEEDVDEDDNDDDDLVHEFGGRDSFGEDGYDSSSDNYTSEDEHEENDVAQAIGCNFKQPLSIIGSDNKIDCEIMQQQTRGHRFRNSFRRQRNTCLESKQMDVFQPYISLDHRTDLVNTWSRAVERSMQWTKVHQEEVKRIDYQRLSSLPISMYLFFSIGMVALSGVLSTNGSLSTLAPK